MTLLSLYLESTRAKPSNNVLVHILMYGQQFGQYNLIKRGQKYCASVNNNNNKKIICRTLLCPRSGELRTHKLKSHLMRTQSLKVVPLKPGVGQYIAMHATLTARDFFLANFYPSCPSICIFFKTSPEFFLC